MTEFELLMLGVTALGIPWAAWVSKTLWAINQHTTGLLQRVDDNERRIEDLERLLPRHIPGS